MNDIDRNYQWFYLPSMQVTLHGVMSRRQEVSHKTDVAVEKLEVSYKVDYEWEERSLT